MTNALEKGIQILKHAINNNLSITQACLQKGYNDRSLRRLRINYPVKTEQSYQEFLKLYNQVLAKVTSTNNSVKYDINDVIDSANEADQELGLLNGDTIIKKESLKGTEKDGVFEVDYRGNEIIKTADQLLIAANVDLNIWKLDKEIVNKWDVTMKLKTPVLNEEGKPTFDQKGYPITVQEPATFQNHQVKLFCSRKRTVGEQTAFEEFLDAIRDNAPIIKRPHPASNIQNGQVVLLPKKKYLLELSLPDLHIGKLSWEDESGENFDTKIAVERYNESVSKLLNHVRHYKDEIDEILLPIGNDLFNIDNKNNMTTAGTPQHVDSRWQQMFYKAKELKIKNINNLMQIAPVKVVMVSGNHDQQTVFYLGSVLEAYYRNTSEVTVDNTPTQRKYHEYGINLIGFTHGNEEKHQDLGLIMATEQPEKWARTKNRQFHLGHFHSRKTTKYLDVQEFQGFTVRVLPSLSGTDAWHNSKGYMSMKSAVAYLYDKSNGLVGEFSHNII